MTGISATGAAGAMGAPPVHAVSTSSTEVPFSVARAAADRCTRSVGIPRAAAAVSSSSLTLRHSSQAVSFLDSELNDRLRYGLHQLEWLGVLEPSPDVLPVNDQREYLKMVAP